MKKIIYICLLILITFAYAKSDWVQTGEMSPGNTDIVRAIAGDNNGNLYASNWARGVYKSTNSGASWIFSGLPGKRVTCLSVAPNGDVYGLSMTNDFSYIHRSTDNGLSWTDVFAGSFPLNFAGGGNIVYPDDGSILAAFSVTVGPTIGNVGTYVYKSTDSGNNWFQTQLLGAGFAGGMIVTDDSRILLGSSLSGVLSSTNNGQNFQSLTTFPPIFIKTILKDNLGTIYVSDAYGLNRSTDNGLTFTDIGNNNTGISLKAACVSSDDELFQGIANGNTYYSNDKGNTWTSITEGMPEDSYFLSLESVGGRIYGGTNNSGVLVYDFPTNIVSQNNTATEFKLSQNFPNPFNPSTVINYEIPRIKGNESQNVNLAIYNSLGKKIKTLVSENQYPGSYSVEWNAADFPSGIYFYRLSAGEFGETKKMNLIK